MLPERLAWIVALSVALVVAGCGPVIVPREGHRIFNPAYSFALDWRDRDEWQKPDEVMAALALGEGDVVADIGAGSGYFTERFARRVGASGRVYATDVQDAMLARLRARVAERALANVEVVRATFDDPNLPDACCKVVFFSSVYNEIDGRVAYLRKVARTLEPGGRVAVLEYRPEADQPGPPRAMRLDPQDVIAEFASAGFTLVARHEFVDREYFLVFESGGPAARGRSRAMRKRSAARRVARP
jgi:ubiquinone/menaquinone biosynthesis C-methylase UbiE